LDKVTKCLFHCTSNKGIWTKKIKFHAGIRKCHFGNFSEIACKCDPQKALSGIEKFYLFWVHMNTLMAELEVASFLPIRMTYRQCDITQTISG
jgi:hypothetical protein